MKKYSIGLFSSVFSLTTFFAHSQTYNSIISDKVYYDFINKDILRDSIKVKHHIFRLRFQLNPDEFYFKDSADFYSKNNNSNYKFIFRTGAYRSNELDTIFTRRDIDFFGEQFKAMAKGTAWQSPFVNSILIDSVEYDKKDKHVFGRRTKWGFWRYSLPLFSLDKRYAIIIKLGSGSGGYYIYRLNKKGEWILVKILNQYAED
jgi:glutathione synthase/RimK-type ligase-like ATP-grasp enzyme